MTARHIALAFAAASLALASAAHAQPFPVPGKPIRIVVPFSAGGQADVQARAIGQKFAESLGVSVIVENKPGGSTLLGSREVQRAAPDGHTLLYTIATHVQLPHLFKNPPWDVFTDFTPITTGSRSATVLTAHVSVPLTPLPNSSPTPSKIPASSTMPRSAPARPRISMAPAFASLPASTSCTCPIRVRRSDEDHLAGVVELFFDGPTTAISNAATGRVKLIATAAETRKAALPDLPTMREQGYSASVCGLSLVVGTGRHAPATVDALYRHLAKVIQSPDVRELFAKGGTEASGMPPAEMAREAKSLSDRWGAVIGEVGVRLEP